MEFVHAFGLGSGEVLSSGHRIFYAKVCGAIAFALKPCCAHWIDSLFLAGALMLFRTLYRSDVSKVWLVSQLHFVRSSGHLLIHVKSVRDL